MKFMNDDEVKLYLSKFKHTNTYLDPNPKEKPFPCSSCNKEIKNNHCSCYTKDDLYIGLLHFHNHKHKPRCHDCYMAEDDGSGFSGGM